MRLPTHGGIYAWEFAKGGRELRVRVEGQIVLNGTTPMRNAALAGMGLAYVPEDLVQPDLETGALRRVLDDWCPPYSGYHLYYPSRRQSFAGVCTTGRCLALPGLALALPAPERCSGFEREPGTMGQFRAFSAGIPGLCPAHYCGHCVP